MYIENDCALCMNAIKNGIASVWIKCISCDDKVHEKCLKLNRRKYICGSCKRRKNKPICIACPNSDGPIIYTSQKQPIHVICALGLSYAIFISLRPVTVELELCEQYILKNKRCSVCDSSEMHVKKCDENECQKTFHVTCAQRKQLLISEFTNDKYIFNIYCKDHLPLNGYLQQIHMQADNLYSNKMDIMEQIPPMLLQKDKHPTPNQFDDDFTSASSHAPILTTSVPSPTTSVEYSPTPMIPLEYSPTPTISVGYSPTPTISVGYSPIPTSPMPTSPMLLNPTSNELVERLLNMTSREKCMDGVSIYYIYIIYEKYILS